MQLGIMLSLKLLKKYQYPVFIFFIPILIILVRYHDVRGSFFPDSYQFKQVSGVIDESSNEYASKGAGFNVRYKYEVSGQTYTSDRVGFSWKSSRDKEKIKALLDRFPIGKEVIVFYASNDPAFSVLEPNRNSKTEFVAVFCMLYAFGILVAYLTRKSITKTSSGRKKTRR
jgi:hypothetical protein